MSESRSGSHRSFRLPASPAVLSRALAGVAVFGTVVGLSLTGSSAALATTGGPGLSGVFISEVQTHGAGQADTPLTDGDWIELHNTTGSAVNLTGAILADNDNTHKYVIGTNSPAGTASIAAGGYQAYRVDSSDNKKAANFSLGDVDEARLYASGATVGTSPVADEFDWNHSAVNTWARDFTQTGDVWEASAETTLNAANVFTATSPDISSVKVNEVNMNGGASGDWVELYNTGASPVTLTGAVLSDDDDTHAYVIGADPGDTATIAAGGFAVYQVDALTHDGNFGLGDSDSVELYPSSVTDLFNEPTNPAASTPSSTLPTATDATSWTSAPIFTWARSTDGTGTFGPSTGPTEGESNADAPAPPAIPSLAGIVINEVKTTGDPVHGDWIELHNTNTGVTPARDLSNAILSDQDDGNIIRIASGTTLANGQILAIRTDNPDTHVASGSFGLGDADKARLFTAGSLQLGVDTPVDSFSWTEHATTSYGRLTTPGNNTPNDNADWAVTNNPTFGTVNDFSSPTDYNVTSTDLSGLNFVQINEVESTDNTGDPFPSNDWIELINTAPVAINIANTVVSDNDNSDAIVLSSSDTTVGPDLADQTAGTNIQPGDFAVVKTDDDTVDVDNDFGLGSNDAARLFPSNVELDPTTGGIVAGQLPIDHFEWTSHPTGSYQRQDSGLGGWDDCLTITAGGPNSSGTGCSAV